MRELYKDLDIVADINNGIDNNNGIDWTCNKNGSGKVT